MSETEVMVAGQTPHEFALTMRAKDRSKYVQKVILDLLEKNKAQGMSVSDIVSATDFKRDTVAKHLEILVASREAYKAGDNSARYHKNGRVVHFRQMANKSFGKRLYTFYQLNNPDGEFIYIQEKEVGRFRTVEDKGGIMVSKEDVGRFMIELKEFMKEVAEGVKS